MTMKAACKEDWQILEKHCQKIKPARSSRALPALYKGKGAHAAACFKIRNALYNRRPARYNVQEIAAARQTCLPGECEVQAGKHGVSPRGLQQAGRGCRAREGFLEGMYMRHLIDPLDFTVEELDRLLRLGEDIRREPGAYSESCKGKKLATLFYEPSTRTRLSHEAAMINLGGSVLGFSSADSSSASKGESVADTIRVISCFADICAMRHPKEGAAMVASQYATIPVINAGDGGHQHPTQTLTDLLTIRSLKGRLDNMTIGLCGDLKFGRTVHSLIHALVRYPGIRFVLISPEELKLPSYIKNDVLDRQNIPYEEVVRLEDALPDLDILYMTRVQKERFFNEEDYVRMKDFYILDNKKMELAKDDMYILHPLPRVNEIATEVDNDPRAAYFKQVQYGVYIRMALILTLLGIEV